jgi:cyclopropane fatty-acyl-phospholipid synthase-like methyltransferase
MLQLMYLGDRLKTISPGRFIEIGPGSGEITRILLEAGWSGTVYDLSEDTISSLKQRFSNAIAEARLSTQVGDFLQAPSPEGGHADLIISCMVMEHMDAEGEQRFMEQAAKHLSRQGLMIGLVPASMTHWGIEDEIAGHYRRYDRNALSLLFRKTGWATRHLAGLTYPLSNMILTSPERVVRLEC